ncbi:MAG TPA: F0F1 ATP synthase subunit A [Acidimicrobiales bacterium]|jgi:F-type H+-transporting ATPase subunit a|nr:F0F1 ATP synthase subunit A [Acidimicrobiales bacterium]
MILGSENITDELLDFHLIGPITAHQFLLIFAGVFMVGLFWWAARRLPHAPKATGLLALLEFGLVWVRDEVVYPWLGPEEGRRYLPLCWTMFFFVLFSNLFGLMPFSVVPHARTDVFTVATGNIAVTGGLAIIVFVIVLMAGMRVHGIGGYWKTLVPGGVPAPLVPIIWFLEFVGLLTRTFALAIRLFANMLAGHALLGILFGFLIGIEVVASPTSSILPTAGSALFLICVMLFEVLIALIQAYIFTILTAIFISLSVAEAH